MCASSAEGKDQRQGSIRNKGQTLRTGEWNDFQPFDCFLVVSQVQLGAHLDYGSIEMVSHLFRKSMKMAFVMLTLTPSV